MYSHKVFQGILVAVIISDYPCDDAAQVALTTTRKWLKTHKDKVG